MLDRASTFAEPEIVKLLQTRCVPVAIDQAYQRRQQDDEGDFYRKIAGQGPRNNFSLTTQGLYLATPDGELLLFNNNRDPEKVRRLLLQKVSAFEESEAAQRDVDAIKQNKVDARYNPQPPDGGLVIRVRAKVLGGYPPATDRWQQIFQNAVSRDNLWITKAEHEALAAGKLPESLQKRLARYHLVDNTRGEPPMWTEAEIRNLNLALTEDRLNGTVHLETASGDRGYMAQLLGEIESKDGRVTRFDLIALGDFWGEGRWTGGAPAGKFPLAVSFALADGSQNADAVPPQGSRGWVPGYLR